MSDYLMGKKINSWRNEKARVITFVVTQDCNLRCKYCYMVDKQSEHKMNFNVAKQALDYLIENKDNLFHDDYVILDFIGGEPLLEIQLIDKIVDYFKLQTYLKNSEWFGRYRISLSTNGILYSTPEVQRFINKNHNLVSIGISIDGTERKHNLQRVFPDGRGSYNEVVKNIKLWKEQFPNAATKVTIGHDDLPYVKESIIHLWEIGIKEVPANVVFEDVWEEGDDLILEEQLKGLADYILDNHLWTKYNTSLFSEDIGYKLSENEMKHNFCGTGKAYTIDSEGEIYPCIRYLDFSLNNKESIRFGNINDGVDLDRVRPFYVLNTENQSETGCQDCVINAGCAFCQAVNYNYSTRNTNFERATYICNMHKARCRANDYYWAKLFNTYGIRKKSIKKTSIFYERQVYFLLSDNSIEFCNYSIKATDNRMDEKSIIKGLSFAKNNFYQPILVHDKRSRNWLNDTDNSKLKEELLSANVIHIMEFESRHLNDESNIIYTFNRNNIMKLDNKLEFCIFLIRADEIDFLSSCIQILLRLVKRINIRIKYNSSFNLDTYCHELIKIADELVTYYQNHEIKEVNLLTDLLYLKKMDNCFAGEKNLTLAPDGNYYACPAFYYEKQGMLDINENKLVSNQIEMLTSKRAFVCQECDAYQCNRCVFENKKTTGEFNIPNKFQCIKSHAERKCSQYLLNKLHDINIFKNKNINNIYYEEPFELFSNITRKG